MTVVTFSTLALLEPLTSLRFMCLPLDVTPHTAHLTHRTSHRTPYILHFTCHTLHPVSSNTTPQGGARADPNPQSHHHRGCGEDLHGPFPRKRTIPSSLHRKKWTLTAGACEERQGGDHTIPDGGRRLWALVLGQIFILTCFLCVFLCLFVCLFLRDRFVLFCVVCVVCFSASVRLCRCMLVPS